ncbi:MAG: hypothetical protein IDH49_15385 [Gammaproteobacteria bacterium]|nr:hypothetical protein [Gammaproteobacteria bacterium]
MRSGRLSVFKVIGLILMMGVSMSAGAGLFGFGGETWKEEVLLHDGRKIIVERTVERGGRHEMGQKPPYKEQSLRFTLPGTKQEIIWEDRYSEDVGSANFLPMALDMAKGIPYIVAYPMGCLSYNKWGRPNPPYVIFKYQNRAWERIPLQELPVEIKTPNLIFSSPDDKVKELGKHFISAETIAQIIEGYRQPEYKTILREPVKGGEGVTSCEELVYYKGAWVGPGDSIGRRMMDRMSK